MLNNYISQIVDGGSYIYDDFELRELKNISGLVDRSGKIYICSIYEHYELKQELEKRGEKINNFVRFSCYYSEPQVEYDMALCQESPTLPISLSQATAIYNFLRANSDKDFEAALLIYSDGIGFKYTDSKTAQEFYHQNTANFFEAVDYDTNKFNIIKFVDLLRRYKMKSKDIIFED